MTVQPQYTEALTRWRRTFHRRPEEGWTEFETTYAIVKRLEELGLEVLKGRAVVSEAAAMGRNPALVEKALERAKTHGVPEGFLKEIEALPGAVAILRTTRPGPVLAVRCDIDCVKVAETEDASHEPVRQGFASECAGLMHACGHDAHAAVGLVFCQWLVEHRDSLCGTVKVIFQPAEEGVRGANAMQKAGVVSDVDYFVGAHVGLGAAPGEVGLLTGGFLATTKLDLTFTGKASHAGSDPEKGRNALLAACHAAIMMTGATQHSAGTTRLCVGTLVAGEGRNVTPAKATMQIETRGETEELNAYVRDNALQMARAAAQAYGVTVQSEVVGEASNLLVDAAFTDALAEILEARGVRTRKEFSKSGSEDCAAFARDVLSHGGKAAYLFYGSICSGHHMSDFDLKTEADTLTLGLECFVAFAERYAGRSN